MSGQGGRPPHQPSDENRRFVAAMASVGINQEDIARVVGIHPDTLRLHYRDELDKSMPQANARVAQNLFRIATGEGREAVVAAIFWLKCRAGWSEFSPPKLPEESLGKKEQQQIQAETAERGTGWAGLVH